MTPPIGFTTGSLHDSQSPAATGGILAQVGAVAGGTAISAHSPVADYAYRIAALTAGLALIVTFI